MFLSLTFVSFVKIGANWIYFILIELVFFTVYITKSILLYLIGYNTLYLYSTIKTFISEKNYLDSLEFVTICHILILFFLVLFSFLLKNQKIEKVQQRYISNRFANRILLILIGWIICSSIVMYISEVGVMGTTGIRLPYQLSGILFYSRTILLPIVFLYLLEKSIISYNKILFKNTTAVFVLLAVSEILVRASKGPFLKLILLIAFLFVMTFQSGHISKIKISKKKAFTFFMVTLMLFPIIEIYRAISVQQLSASSAFELLFNQNILLIGIEHFFHRLIGFTQLAGIIAMDYSVHGFGFISEYGNIARFYTEIYLGYKTEGHLSSPSILGAALIVGGNAYWIFLCIYIFFMTCCWRLSSFFRCLSLPIKSLLGYELFNTLMAGTVTLTFTRIILYFSIALFIEPILRTSLKRN
jgi:hypothetical protein